MKILKVIPPSKSMKYKFDNNSLKEWFNTKKRDLPWRHTQDPYAIWISEVMLQQTQVAVVIPYYLNWMKRYPSIQSLAEDSLDGVIKNWEGLGYYSRARHLHAGAKYILENLNGVFPNDEKLLYGIKGLGPYTVGAILSFAFHQRIAAVDGNVLRVLTRYFGIKEDITKSKTQKKLRGLALEILPETESWIINEALIELGATVCQKKAKCYECPLSKNCVSYLDNLTEEIPVKSKKPETENLYRSVAIIQHQSLFLVKRGEKGRVMSDLYEFPYFERKEEDARENFLEKISIQLSLYLKTIKSLEEIKHGFTRYRVRLYPWLFNCEQLKPVEGYEWIESHKLKELPFSSGHRRILKNLQILF